MSDNCYKLSTKELLDLIDNSPNYSLDPLNSFKEIIIGKYSIQIYYGKNSVSYPQINLSTIKFYDNVQFDIKLIVDDVLEYFPFRELKKINNLPESLKIELANLYSGIDSKSFNDKCVYFIQIKNLLSMIKIISRINNLQIFI